ncbi:MAG: flippase-like domain-containing protein, partial [Clostridia bacterium]|nr:flippase-like domain-containing protein [Clostridia bacterium]
MNNCNTNSSKKRIIFNIIFVFVLMTSVFVYIGHYYNLSKIIGTLSSISWVWNVLAIAALVVQYFSESLCFTIMLKSFGRSIGFRRAIEYTSVDLFYMNISPFAVGGIPAQALYMTGDGISKTHTGISITMFTCLNKVAMLISSIFAILIIPGIFVTGNPYFGVTLVYGFLFMAGIILCCGSVLLFPKLVSVLIKSILKILKKFCLIKDTEKLHTSLNCKLKDYSVCSDYIKNHPSVSLAVFALCVVKRFAMIVPAYFVYRGLGLSGQSFIYIIAVQAILGMALESFVLPGAIGVYETAAMAFYPGIFGDSLALPAILYIRTFCYILVVISTGTV